MATSVEDIVAIYEARKRDAGPLLDRMRAARDHMNGDVIVPLPEMDRNEKPAVSNLIAQGLEQTAMRVASVLPNMVWPAVTPGVEKGKHSEDWARIRHQAVAGWWEQNHIQRKLRRMARWLIGYATTPVYVRPDFDNGIPSFELRNPLNTFAAPTADWDDMDPTDVVFAYMKPATWLESQYPGMARRLIGDKVALDNVMVEVLEYCDAEEIVTAVSASRMAVSSMSPFTPLSEPVELDRVPNRAGVCLAVSAKKIAFDKLFGQFHHIYGMYQAQSKLMALELIAVEKGIFPDLVMYGTVPGRTPVLINGDWKDGREGEVNVIKDGRIETVALNPGFMGQPAQDRLERNMRTTAYVPSQFGGESPTNIQTGRLGDQLLSATVDFPIQEYQELLADALESANRRAIAVSKGYFGGQSKSFHVNLKNAVGKVEYTPNQHFETDEHKVSYAAPGADVNSLVLGIGQRMGIGTMSAYTGMLQDPMIPDPDLEVRRVNSEYIERALRDSIAELVRSQQMHPLDAALMAREIETGTPLARAFEMAQEQAQERQAEEQAAQQAQAAAGQPIPGAQPGLGPQPQPGEAGMPITGPTPSMEGLSQLLGSLRQPRAIGSPLENAAGTPVQAPVG